MVAILDEVLSRTEVAEILGDMERSPMVEGRLSAGEMGQELKTNLQVDSASDLYQSMVGTVMAALQSHKIFNQHAIPRRIHPPLFSRYKEGSFYKRHVDNAFMGPFPAMRTDLSITIFLSDPDSYQGGTLTLETPFGLQEYRLQPGDAILYPTYYPHYVSEVTSGERLAVVTWVESLVREPLQREVIADLSNLVEWAIAEEVDMDTLQKMEKTRLNLLKMWSIT
jgi:PKHD-type hydroxylase